MVTPIDVGLKSGLKFLREHDMFLDFTIKAGGEEFLVHKLVLVSVSHYFRTMLNGSMKESEKSEVEFPQFSAKQMSVLIEFIYSGYGRQDDILDDHAKELLECGVYFQMPKVIKACLRRLTPMIKVANCLDLLDTFVKFSLHGAAKEVRSFISRNAKKVMNHFKTREIPEEVMRIFLKAWKKSEWEMFIYLTTWFSADFENHKEYLNEFMSHVRFFQMIPDEIEAVKDMDVYKDGEGAWKDQVDNASQGRASYEELPIYQKVVADPEQIAVRNTKALYTLDIGRTSAGAASRSFKDKWNSCWKAKGLEVSGTIPFVIEVNNFLVTCSEFGEDQTWQIFDPRTLTWSKIANMSTPRDEFAMVYHDKHLYVLGGTEESAQGEKVLTDTVEVYSFETNTWSSDIKLPVPVKNHAACCLNGAIYISGGEIATDNGTHMSDRFDRLDISSRCWESKAPMQKAKSHHPMILLQIYKQGEHIFVIDKDTSFYYYDPITDLWSFWHFCYTVREGDMMTLQSVPWVPGQSKLLQKGNILYFLNLQAEDESSDSTDGAGNKDVYVCLKWVMGVSFNSKRSLTKLGDSPSSAAIACILGVPQHVKQKSFSAH